MSPPPEVPPMPGVGVPVQRVVGVSDEVPAAWLTDPEHLDAADRVDRLTEDVNLVTALALAGYQGPQYGVFETELARYGMAVIGGWIRRGLIFARCRDRGFGGLPEAPLGAFDDPDVVQELSDETVAKALVHFRDDVLMKNRWDFRKGASLRTFFIGQCLIRFANVYRAWHKSESMHRRHDLADIQTLDELERRRIPGVAELVADQDLTDRALASISDERVRKVMVLVAAGVPQTEIATRLGVTVKAVERMLANERDRLRGRGIA